MGFRKYKRNLKDGRAAVRFTRRIKRHGGSGGSTTIVRRTALPYVFPDRYMCKLKYACEFTLDAEANGGCKVKTFFANLLYDPDTSIGGRQPCGFDQLALFYNHFTVIGSKIRMIPTFATNAGVVPAYYGVALSATAGEITGYAADDIFAQSNNTRSGAQHGILNAIQTSYKGRTMTFSLKKFFNEHSIDDDQYQCTASANPTEGAYFDCWACPIAGNDPATLNFIVTIEYIVVCHEPKRVVDA